MKNKLLQFLVEKLCLILQLYISWKSLQVIIANRLTNANLLFAYSTICLILILYIQSIGSIGSEIDLCIMGGISISTNKYKSSQWNNILYPLDNTIFTRELLKKFINKFWKENILQLDKFSHILLLTRIRRDNGQMATIGTLQKLNVDDKDYLYQHLLAIIELKTGGYVDVPITGLVFSFGIRSGLAPIKTIETDVKYQHYYNFKFPITMDPLKYGKLILKMDNKYIIQMINKNLAIIYIEDNLNKIMLYKDGELKYEWIDRYIDESTFIREIGPKKFTYVNDELTLLTVDQTSKFIKKTKLAKKHKNDFLTMDLETRLIDNKHSPYSLSFYDGFIKKSFFINDYSDKESMVIAAMKDIAIRKYKNYKIYLHNFAKFDNIFLFKILANLGIVSPTIHKGRFISLQFSYNNYNLYFRDSYLLLPSSLRKLCKSFKVLVAKSFFPHTFLSNKMVDILNYIGIIPSIQYFLDSIPVDDDLLENINNLIDYFSKNKDKIWNLKNEAIKYCELDCVSLHQILSKFNNLIYDKWQLNMTNYPTLPSLAFAIFRAHYLKDNSVVQISGQIYKDIKQSYTGGAVDMYIPENQPNEKIYAYDVNSLYPYVMKENIMPVRDIVYFEGDIRKFDSNALGYFYCKIKTPDNLDHPILQIHFKTENGLRTMSPLGSFEAMIYSKEMDNMIKLGYSFEILWGYTFKGENIFKDIINDLYTMRKVYSKSDPMNYIAKILMNSLYGRFGMDDSFSEWNIIDKNLLDSFIDNKTIDILDIIDLDNKIMIQYKSSENINSDGDHNINIAIASAITSYSRIHMSQFKNHPNYKLFYTDTDSIYINKPLDDSYVSSNELGKLKLEAVANKAIFLSSKVYALQTDNQFISKVKGLHTKKELKIINNSIEIVDNSIPMKDFDQLLYKNSSLKMNQEKWYKSLENSRITVKNQIYTLSVTSNKRQLIYDNNKLINTKAYIINNNKLIN
jgi:hypothetical protein